MGKYLALLDGAALRERWCDKSDQSDKRSAEATGAAAFGRLCRFGRSPDPAGTMDIWGSAQEERAAVIEYDGRAPRNWAEALARLDPDKPPSGVSPHRWQRFINDCGRFLDGGWAEKAAALGWGPLQLFGCDRKRPSYVPNRGLLWEVNGGTVVDLRRDRAIIEIRGGARRSHSRVGRIVLAWELTQTASCSNDLGRHQHSE
jgi:hypothetical protein